LIELRVDPEFRDKIPPLTEAEYEQLRENILEEGEVYEPIAVWNGVIVDGHNRWKIICENKSKLEGKFRVKEMDFPDKWAAFAWMYKMQLGRRNLTNEQKKLMLGEMKINQSKSIGGQLDNKNAKRMAQSEPIVSGPKSTAEAIAREVGVSRETVKRAEKFAKGIHALTDVNKEASDKVLKGKTGISEKTVMEIPKMEPEQKKELAEAIVQGTIKEYQKKSTNPNGWNKQAREDRKQTERVVDELFDVDRTVEQTIDRFLNDIRWNGKAYVDLLSNSIRRYRELITDENRKDVILEIETVITGIKKMEETL
jgi:predicted transcriptional regulator